VISALKKKWIKAVNECIHFKTIGTPTKLFSPYTHSHTHINSNLIDDDIGTIEVRIKTSGGKI
jgi:hypothetical protein